jgi:geranylgeranyl diphosphate synthase, type I
MGLPAVFERYHAQIDETIKSIIDERKSSMYNMLRYHFGWVDSHSREKKQSNGKAVRPTLCLLTCEAVGGDSRLALPAAAGIEMVHNYSLIHDDIQDNDVERHHQPTVWRVWGKAQAINAGTAMRMLAAVALRRTKVPPDTQISIQNLIDEATISIIEGQYLDISFESRTDISVPEYIEMIGNKTAALITCAVEIGAELGTENRKTIVSLRKFGWNLGMAFQTRDDILGIWGKKAETGKPSGNDIRRRKKTLPVIYAIQNASLKSRETLIRSFSNEKVTENTVQTIIGILEDSGAREYTQKITEQYIDKAVKILNRLPIVPSIKNDLNEVVSFLKDRTF